MTTMSISACIPARNEAATIGELVRAVVAQPGLLEVLVLNHASTDATEVTARDAGARVVSADDVLPEFGPALGKGDVLWRSVHIAQGDVIVWLDADLRSFTPEYLTALVQPFAADANIALVKPDYARTINGNPTGGGRITERTAKPALRELHPHLAHIHQPLAGEYAIRREVARQVPFEIDYGVEIGLLIDVANKYGTEAIAEVKIPPRVHRNRPDAELAEPSHQVLRTTMSRAGLTKRHIRPPLASIESAVAYA
jgi:glucosyl-3-phosphoglycerate synthase